MAIKSLSRSLYGGRLSPSSRRLQSVDRNATTVSTIQENAVDGSAKDERASSSNNGGDDYIIQDHDDTHSTSTIIAPTTSTVPSKYAYMFLIGGIDPNAPGYRGFLYNVMIATYILRTHGSRSDVVLFLQMSTTTTSSALPNNEEKQLQDLGIKYRYMEKPTTTASFSDIIMEKFRILTLTEYKRVMFLDADVLPVTSLDHYMELSDQEDHGQSLLQPNFIVATRGEPANAGLFMVSPHEGDYESLQKIIYYQRESAKSLPYPHFDKEYGWGHSFIKAKDKWEGTVKSGIKWGFWCAHSDQGLLYYWTKYFKNRVTIFRGSEVQNWVKAHNGANPVLQNTLNPGNLTQYAPPTRSMTLHGCNLKKNQEGDNYMCQPPYSDYHHFTGGTKPWQNGYNPKQRVQGGRNGQINLWWKTLFSASIQFGWNITKGNANDLLLGSSPLGYVSKWSETANATEQHEQKTDIEFLTKEELLSKYQ
ncbi:MAG: hypothetical protein SGILL_007670 [Bacillariaceae sp.]